MSPRAKQGESFREPIGYERALRTQEELVRRRQAAEIPDTLWLLEHPLTVTFGSSGDSGHLRVSREDLAARGIALYRTHRGGDVTCHEPGQLVGYPIVHLADHQEDRDIHAYLRRLEDGLIACLDGLGLTARRVEGRTGVWVDGSPERKIIAMGVRCSRWVTSHGFAFNVENDLEGFRTIVPCGIEDAEVTSLAREMPADRRPDWDALCSLVHRSVETALGRKLDLLRGAEAFEPAEPDS